MGQRVHYVDDQGNPGAAKAYSDALTVAICWTKATDKIGTQFAVAVASHEPNTPFVTNEQDDDTRDDGNGGEKVIHRTGGIFQLDIPSASPFQAGDPITAFGPIIGATKSVFDVQDACDVFAVLCERRLAWLVSNFPDMAEDVRRYWLAVGHNLGTGTMRSACTKHQGDVDDFENDNPELGIVKHGYGRDCMTGGQYWTEAMGSGPLTQSGQANAPALSASTKGVLYWSVLLLLLLVAYYFWYARGKGFKWPVNISV